jgi:hypothetical protein
MRIEELRLEADENLMIILKTLVQVYTKIDNIDNQSEESMATEVFFPALAKVFMVEEIKGTRSNLNFMNDGDSDSLTQRYADMFKVYKDNGDQSFNKFLKQQKLCASGFLDVIFDFYERMLEYEETNQFMQKLNFGALVQGMIEGAYQRN